MELLTLYVATSAVFLILDAVMLTNITAPLFRTHLGDLMLDTPRLGAAAGFYLLYIAGLCWLVSWPALQDGSATRALLNGAVLGAVAYGTYEMTNYATLRAWTLQMVATDWLWGIALTGVSAWAGVIITRWLFS